MGQGKPKGKGARKAGMDAGRLQRIGEFLDRAYVQPGKIAGCQVLVARRGHEAYRATLGLMDVERGRPFAEDAVTRIYSMTKPVVSVALMTLWERGAFQLDDPIAKACPEFRDLQVWIEGAGEDMRTEPASATVTFRQVLSHTAGFTYGGLLEQFGAPGSEDPVDAAYKALRIARDRADDLDAFMGKLARAPLRFQPGTRWMYSLATDAAGALVERLSGRKLDAFLREEVFEPLGMADTGFHVAEGARDRFAACYGRDAEGALKRVDDPEASPFLKPPTFLSGGGGLVSTLEDYGRFCDMLRCGGELDGVRILGPRTLRLMTANHLPGGGDLSSLALDSFSETTPAGVGFGLGFASTQDGVKAGTACQGDFYWGGAASTAFWVDPVEDLYAVFLTQFMPSTTFPFRAQLRSLVYAAIED